MDRETRDPDAGPPSGLTRRREKIRDDEDEHVYVEWFVGQNRQSFTTIYVDDENGSEMMLAANINELGQLLTALRQAKERLSDGSAAPSATMVRDLLGESVRVESEDAFATLVVEQGGEIVRMLVFNESELGELIDAVEQAKDELPSVEMGPHVN